MTTIRSSKGVKKFSQFIVFLEAAVDLVFDFATCEDFKPADFEAEEAGLAFTEVFLTLAVAFFAFEEVEGFAFLEVAFADLALPFDADFFAGLLFVLEFDFFFAFFALDVATFSHLLIKVLAVKNIPLGGTLYNATFEGIYSPPAVFSLGP